MPDDSSSVRDTDDDSTENNHKVSKKRLWLKSLVYLALLVVGLYAASLIVLNTSWAKSKITNRLDQKTGLEWECGSILWLPFSNVVVKNLETKLGQGGAEIKQIIIIPEWGSLLSGEVDYKNIVVDGVVLDLDELWLEQYLADQKSANLELQQAKKPPIPQAQPKPQVRPKQATPAKPKPVQPAPIPSEKNEKRVAPVEKAKRLIVKNIDLKLRRGNNILQEVGDLEFSIPIAGPEADGYFRYKSVDQVTKKIITETMPMKWDQGKLIIDHENIDFYGIKFNLTSVFMPKHPHKLFLVEVQVLDQPLELKSPYPNLDVQLNAEHLVSNLRLEGSLTNPLSWKGRGNIFAKKVSVMEDLKTHSKLEFDYTGAAFQYMAGNLVVQRAEASSFDLTIFMNGVFQKNLDSYGTVRFIATEEVSKKLNRIYNGSNALHVDHNKMWLMQPLDNPDRQYFDIRFDGKLNNLAIKHNRSDHWQSLNEALKTLRSFKDQELKEDGLLKPE